VTDCPHAFRLAGATNCVQCGLRSSNDVKGPLSYFLISGPDGANWWAAENEEAALRGYLCGYRDGEKWLEFLQVMEVRNIAPPKGS
jgi:hypothetical protein